MRDARRRGAGRPPGRRSTAPTAPRRAASEAIDALFAGAASWRMRRSTAPTRVVGDGADVAVAVRSSATAEDLSDASFAGQQETYLSIVGPRGRAPPRRPLLGQPVLAAGDRVPPPAGDRRRRRRDGGRRPAPGRGRGRRCAVHGRPAHRRPARRSRSRRPSDSACRSSAARSPPIATASTRSPSSSARDRSRASPSPTASTRPPARIERVALDAAAGVRCLPERRRGRRARDAGQARRAGLRPRDRHRVGRRPGPRGPAPGPPAAGAARDGAREAHTGARRRRAARRDGSHRLGDARNTAPKEPAMKRSDDRILTTHVGSLARSHELLDAMQARATRTAMSTTRPSRPSSPPRSRTWSGARSRAASTS